MNNSIFISGGGTGGHLFPAISIGNELIKHNFSIIYCISHQNCLLLRRGQYQRTTMIV